MTPTEPTHLRGKRLALLGYGVENRALAQWLSGQGLAFSICDEQAQQAPPTSWDGAIQAWHLGADAFSHLQDFDVLFRSPGIPGRRPELIEAQRTGVVSSGIDLFLRLTSAAVVGVTGTKGKGTTASLLMSLLQTAGRRAWLGGNIGTPPIGFLDQAAPGDVVVLELSSFQLQDLGRSPHGAILLPVTPDHLDYHDTFDEYVEAKGEICRHQGPDDWVVAPTGNDVARSLAAGSAGAQMLAGGSQVLGAGGCWTSEGELLWHDGRSPRAVAALDDVRLRGRHNIDNACCAVSAALRLGVDPEAIPAGLRGFSGLPHRLEEVRQVGGVLYVNDSLATTPEAAAAGLHAWGERGVVLIAGGSSKGADFTELGEAIAQRARGLIGLGSEGPAIVAAAHRAGFDGYLAEDVDSMERAVALAAQLAGEGDVVLLSPGCASFGMFASYAARGDAFRAAVEDLKEPS